MRAEPRPVGHHLLLRRDQRVACDGEERLVDAERGRVRLDAVGLRRVARMAAELDQHEEVDDALAVLGVDARGELGRLERCERRVVDIAAEVPVEEVGDHGALLVGRTRPDVGRPEQPPCDVDAVSHAGMLVRAP